MELDIDYAIAGKYDDYHDCYSRNLKVFKKFIRVFEQFFKKQKYADAHVAMDGEAKNRATIRFAAQSYRLSLSLDPNALERAQVELEVLAEGGPRRLARAAIEGSQRVVFPGDKSVSLADDYEFNNAVLDFFISAARRGGDGPESVLEQPLRK